MRGLLRVILGLLAVLFIAALAVAQDGSKTGQFGASRAATSATVTPPAANIPSRTAPPKAKIEQVVDDYHGVKVTDPYRWLEDTDSPETQAFVRDQLAYTRSVLDPLPGRDAVHARLQQLFSIGTINEPRTGGDYVFYSRREGSQNQPVLYVRKGVNGEDRVLVDVNQLAADGTVALDWFHPSDDGKYVAYGTSPSGSEISTLRIIDTASGKLLPDTIERTRAASIAWKPDSSGFFYTRYPKKGDVPPGMEMYNRKVFYHALGGDPQKDPLIFAGSDPQEWPNVEISEDGRWLAIILEQGWAKSELYLKDASKLDSAVMPVAKGKEFLYSGKPYKGKLYILTNEDAPRFRIFAVDCASPQREHWKEIVPQADAVLKNFEIIGDKIVAEYEKDATSQVRVFAMDGRHIDDVKLPTLGSVTGIGGQWNRNDAFVRFDSYTMPPAILHYDVAAKRSAVWKKVDAPIDAGAFEVKQVWYSSKDGTKVPMFIVAQKGLELNGHNPALLTGYGGFNVSRTPAFAPNLFLWLEHGGVFAEVNLRGGSEFGEEWHRAGMLGNKQNVFDDFIAAAEYLIAQKYTDTDHLSIRGGSNGGLLVGAALTQRPDLYKAVVCQVPLLDMLRYQNFQIAKLWIPEYGSAENLEQFKWLYAYSPYHHVKEGMAYPATLLMTADTDTRVDPMHAKKMAARLQAANTGGNPILLRIEPKAGHGAGKPVSKQVEEYTDIYSFLFWQLGMK